MHCCIRLFFTYECIITLECTDMSKGLTYAVNKQTKSTFKKSGSQ